MYEEIILYHGGTDFFTEIDLNAGRLSLDFGKGFYTTRIKQQAIDWAIREGKRKGKPPIVLIFTLDSRALNGLNYKYFPNTCEEWARFIKENREVEGLIHDYSCVEGAVADDDLFTQFQYYVDGIIDYKMLAERIKYYKESNQVTFHNKGILDYVHLSGYIDEFKD